MNKYVFEKRTCRKVVLRLRMGFLFLFIAILGQSAWGTTSMLTPIGSVQSELLDDDVYNEVSITDVFPGGIQFGSNTYNSMFIGSNGYVTFGSGYASYNPTGIPGFTLCPMVAAQFDDLYPGLGGEVYYSQNGDYLVVTYNAVVPYCDATYGTPNGKNTFQIVLRRASGYNGTTNKNFQIEVRYIDLQWAEACTAGALPSAGWTTGTGSVYGTMPYSQTSNFLMNQDASNVGESGVYRWNVVGGVVQSTPTVSSTTSATSISGSTAISGGSISSDGGSTVTSRGLVCSTSQNPTSPLISSGTTGTGSFTQTLSGLSPNTTYYVRAYATNSLGTSYGPQISFTTSNSYSNPTSGGTISSSQTISAGTAPASLTSTAAATGQSGTLEYKWQYSTTSETTGFTDIASSNSASYSPGVLNASTWYRRLARVSDLGTWTGAVSSNVVKITVVTPPAAPTAGNVNTAYDGQAHTGTATSPAGTSVVWYDAATGGNTTTAPSRTNAGTTTAWAESVNSTDPTNKSTSRTQVSVTVTPVTLTVKAVDQTLAYGEAVPTLNYTISDFVNGETQATAVTGTPALSTAYTAITPVTSSPVSITAAAGSLASTNYNFTFTNGSITITKAMLTATAESKTKVYGETNPSLTFTYSGFKNSDNESKLETKPNISTTVTETTGVGTQTSAITLTGGADKNYDFTYVPADFTVTKAMLTATAESKTKVYGETNPSLTFTYSGFKNSDNESKLETKPNISTTVTETTGVGIQTGVITLTGGADKNYDFTYVPADFTVTKAMLTATAESKTKVYGETNPSLTFTYSGFKNSDNESKLETKPNISTTVTEATGVGTQTSAITLTGGADKNYDFTYVPADFTVTKAMLTATAESKTKVYGETNPSLTFTYSGFKNSDNESKLETKPNISTTVTETTGVGTQTSAITLTGGADKNYDFTYVPADFTVTKAMLTATAESKTKVYGETNPSLTFTYSGFKNSDNESKLETKPSITTTVTETTGVGTQSGAITLTGGADKNYDFTYVPADFTVTKAMLTATAESKTKVYGETNPSLTFTYSGFKNSDNESKLETKPNISTTVTETTGVGTQTSAITLNGGADKNYDFTYVPADFTVTKAMLTATAESKTKVYGETNPSLTFTYSGFKNSDNESKLETKPNISTTVTETTGVGTQTSAITLTGGADKNYDFTYVPADFTVTKAMLTATAESKTKVYGETNPSLTFTYSGFKNSDNESKLETKPTISTTVTETTGVGTQTSAITLTGGADKNYDFTYIPADFTVTKAMLTVSDVQVLNKVYDGNTNATITYQLLNGVVGSDKVAIDKCITGTFAQSNVGNEISITPSAHIVGDDISNYDLALPEGLKANITPKELMVDSAVVKDKVYDGTTVATIEKAVLKGVVGAENVLLSNATTGTFVQSAIGTNISVIPAMTITGTGVSNYTLTQPEGLKANITAKELTVSGAEAKNKIYDGTMTAIIDNAKLEGVVGSENVVLSNAGTGTFIQSQVGTAIPVTTVMTITGTGISNYFLTQPSGLKANITAAPLVVSEPIVQEDKVYDGTDTASVISGFLSNVAPGDAGKVFITANAVYSDMTAGSGRTITITYTISGPAASNYTAPPSISYAVEEAKIEPKQLTITDPTVVTNKMVDGKTDALINEYGVLQGVEAVDEGKITVTAKADYDNASVGTNKTITIVYTINGSASGNYIAPVNKVITGTKISNYITLQPLSTPAPGCEESDLDLSYVISTGTPTQYKITFSEAAHAAGIQDIAYTDLPTSDVEGLLPIFIPKGAPDGDYQGTLQMKNELGLESPEYPFGFTVNLSTDYIIAKFDDVVLCDNSEKRFTSYQWYKDGEEIKGATKQYYCDEGGLVGAYSVKVTTAAGKVIYSCSKTFNTPTQRSFQVSPNPVKISQNLSVKIVGFSDEELEKATLSIFDVDGIRIYHTEQVDRANLMKITGNPGVYIGHVTTEKGTDYVFKIVVTK